MSFVEKISLYNSYSSTGIEGGEKVNTLMTEKDLKIKNQIAFVLGMTLIILMYGSLVYADPDGPSLTAMFQTRALQGSWDVINKFNWLGWLMNFIISVFCLIGMFLVVFQRVVTLVYLSSRNVWNNVHNIHEDSKGGILGFSNLFKRTASGSYGTGLNNFIGFFFGLLPDIKVLSDYNDENMASSKLSEDDTALTNFLKTLPATVALLFFFSAGFNGTLGKCYATIVDGMGAFADNVIAFNIAGAVDDLFQRGKDAPVLFGKDGSYKGDTLCGVFKEARNKACTFGNVRGNDRATLGDALQRQINNRCTEAAINKCLGENKLTDDNSWKHLKYNVVVSEVADAPGTPVTIPLDSIGFQSGTSGYIHIYFEMPNSLEHNYFDTNATKKRVQ